MVFDNIVRYEKVYTEIVPWSMHNNVSEIDRSQIWYYDSVFPIPLCPCRETRDQRYFDTLNMCDEL